jgi:hypothetical protein
MQSADKCLYAQNVAHVCLQHQNKKKWKLAALMDLFQKNSSRLIKLIVTARPNLSWHYSNAFSLHWLHLAFWQTHTIMASPLISAWLCPNHKRLCTQHLVYLVENAT